MVTAAGITTSTGTAIRCTLKSCACTARSCVVGQYNNNNNTNNNNKKKHNDNNNNNNNVEEARQVKNETLQLLKSRLLTRPKGMLLPGATAASATATDTPLQRLATIVIVIVILIIQLFLTNQKH